MRVLFVWHAAVDPWNRPLFDRLIERPGLDLLVVAARTTDDRQKTWRMDRPVERVHPRSGSCYRIVPSRTFWPNRLGRLMYLDLPRRIREFQPDLIHLLLETASLGAAHTAWARNRFAPRTPLVMHVIQNIVVDYRWPIPAMERWVIRNADGMVAYSPGALAVLRHRKYRGPTTIQPFGLAATLYRPTRVSPIRKSLHGSGPVIGWTGRMFLGKGLHVLLKASARMKREHQLLIVGDGWRRPHEQKLAADLGIADRITWAGSIPAGKMPAYYAAMDVFTHPAITSPPDMPYWKEQFARTLPEAMFMGLPIVGSRSGEIPWVIGKGGIIVPENNPSALAKALDRLVADPALRKRLGSAGRKRALSNFTWAHSAAGLRTFWTGLSRGVRAA